MGAADCFVPALKRPKYPTSALRASSSSHTLSTLGYYVYEFLCGAAGGAGVAAAVRCAILFMHLFIYVLCMRLGYKLVHSFGGTAALGKL